MRKTISLLLVLSGVIEVITSVFLYMAPMGRIAYWHNYQFLWLEKTQWRDIHITVGTLFLCAAFIHMYLNWRSILTYLHSKAKQLTVLNIHFNIALLIFLYVMLGTLYSLPPMEQIIQLGKHLTVQANNRYAEPPFHHAERASLEEFCEAMGIDQDATKEVFKDEGILVDGFDEHIGKIAKKNNRSPQQIYEIIQHLVPPGRKSEQHH